MIPSYDFEKEMGIDYFISDTLPLLGKIKHTAEDFIVEEILTNSVVLTLDSEINFNLPGKGDYLYLAIAKKNISTIDVVLALMQKFRLKFSDIGICGIKDKRALAVQCFSIKNLRAEDVLKTKFKKFKVVAYSYGFGPLRVGHHLGNNFKIVIREVKHHKDLIDDVMNKISSITFFPNYFGYQRFGIPRPVTHRIGEAIIKGYYEKAVDELVGRIDPLEPEEHIVARKIFSETHDPSETLKYLPESLVYERIVLEHLLHYPNDYIGSLAKLSITALRLFIESYASYLFNKFLSFRLKNGLGRDPQEGDLVSPLYNESPAFFSLRVGSEISKERALELIGKGKLAIVLPVLGYKAKLSGGIMGDLEREVLINEGIRPSDFKVWIKDKYIGLKGSYRRIDLKFIKLLEYKIIPDEIFNGNALFVSFALPRGCYATTLLREIMKHPFPGAFFGKSPSLL